MYPSSMLALLVVFAQLVDVQLHNQVPAGQKPSLTVKPAAALAKLELSLDRDDGKSFTAQHGALKAGQAAVLSFGDNKGGHAKWSGKLVAIFPDGNRQSFDLTFETAVTGELRVTYARDHLDLDAHTLEFQLSRPAGKAELSIVGDDGKVIGNGSAEFHGEPPGSWVKIGWTQKSGNAFRLELRATSSDGLTTLVRLLPWSVRVAHEEVNFEPGKSEVRASETPKLDGSYQKIIDAVELARKADGSLQVRLFIAGHTDTVGSTSDNRKLSLERARAIAAWFHERGLPLPVLYAGFGEEAPKVKTPDNTDEARNRRADYIVGVEEPLVARGVKATWYSLK
jgi:outer membrane protein OmpA-like peptidoglycan-associated protein